MVIACSPTSSQPCTPELIDLPGEPPFAITVRMDLTGNGSILNAPNVSPDLEIWNSFAYKRTMAVTFNSESGGSMFVIANVGTFSAVPEPTNSAVIVGMAFAYLLPWLSLRPARIRSTRTDYR
jgi:hypothetical protein